MELLGKSHGELDWILCRKLSQLPITLRSWVVDPNTYKKRKDFMRLIFVCYYYMVIQFGQVERLPSQYCVRIGCLTSGRERY